jgi:glycosyltransferase involved in cell wall biosynthesis
MNDLVSVMIGVYNCEDYLAEAIESVFAQTYSPIELIVVDDGSTDGTAQVAQAYVPRARYAYQERGGMGAGRNHAVSLASGKYLAFLDADDRFRPTKIAKQVEAFARDPQLDVVFGRMTEFITPDLDPDAAARLRRPVDDAPWPTPNLMLVTREAFERVGLFSTTLRVGIGVDWYARAIELALKQEMIDDVVLERRLHTQNNGIREQASRSQYLHVLKASIDRRRAQEAARDADDEASRHA